MSLLTMVQQVAMKVLKTQASAITTAVGSADPNILDIVAYLNEDGRQQSDRYSWEQLRSEATFATGGAVGGIGTLTGLAGGAGYASGLSTTYNLVPLTGGHGAGALATIAVLSGVVSSVTLVPFNQGSGYQVGDVLSASNVFLGNTGAGFSITVQTIAIVGVQNQGSIITLTGPDFNFVVNETFWDRTTRRPVFGPKSPAEWQQLLAQQMQGPWWQFTLRGGNLLMLPPPSPGDLIAFEWCSKYWCTNQAGTQGQTAMIADADVAKLDEDLLVLGGIWRFKKGNGLDYQADLDKAEGTFADMTSRDGVRPTLNMNGARDDVYPGILVPSGNWPISGEPSG